MSRLRRIKGKLYDTGTKNTTFLKVARDLKTLGIKNFYFMLELNDPSLIDIDPYAENLTLDQISRIMNECTRNVWYYLREVCRIPQQGGVPCHFKANRGNVASIWCTLHGIDSWLCLPRQQGKTVSILALLSWMYSFGTNDSKFIFINKDGDNAKSNLQILADIIECLPYYLHFEQVFEEDTSTPGKMKVTKAKKNATSIKHPVTKNQIITKASAASYTKALSMARGMTSPILHFDPDAVNG